MNLFERAGGAAPAGQLFTDQALIAAMVRFEVELARAQAHAGLIPVASAVTIAQAVDSFTCDPDALATAAAHAGTLAIPLVQSLRKHVAAIDAEAARWVHFGSTSQDVLDTALVLCTQESVAALADEIDAATKGATGLALRHRDTPMLARTLMQAAGITTFGYKSALWQHALGGHRARLTVAAQRGLCVSLGGAVGNLAAYGDHGAALRAALAEHLGLRDPGVCWHTHRQDWLALACEAALLCGTLAKIAGDIALMAQTEVGEVREPHAEGRGTSSAMPHKRNPVMTLHVLTLTQGVPNLLATLLSAQGQEHERALGGWQAEQMHWPALFRAACAATHAMAKLLQGLEVDASRCDANIASMQGVIFAESAAEWLSGTLGKPKAQALLAELCSRALSEGTPLSLLLSERMSADSRLSGLDIRRIEALFSVNQAARISCLQIDDLLRAPH